MWQMHDLGSGWWLVMGVMLVVFVALVIWLVLNGQRSGSSTARTAPASPQTAMEILDRRLAAGEITIEDYEQRRRTLARDVEHTAA